MNKIAKILLIFVGLIVVVFIGLSIFIGTLNADRYRPQLVAAIHKKTGRDVRLNGPIAFSLGLGGVHVAVQDAALGNPSWASRPVMAGMGKFELGVGLLPLLAHKLSVNELTIENADILLESNAAGQHNWDMTPDGATKTTAQNPTSSAPSTVGASLSIASLTITNSQLAMRAADGKVSSYNVASLHLDMSGQGAVLSLQGDVNATPIKLTVKTSLSDLLSKAPFNFDADLSYDVFHLTAQGKADLTINQAEITTYQMASGKTVIGGHLSAAWGGTRPTVQGAIASDHIDLADFKTASSDSRNGDTNSAASAANGNKRLFSNASLPLSGLKAADADMDVTVGEFILGKDALKKISAKLVLSNGDLSLVPVKTMVGAAPVDIQVKLNAAQNPAHLTFGLVSNDVDLGDLQRLADMSPFMTGKASANVQLSSDGNSAHDLASNLGGVITVTAEKGEILSGAAAGVSSTLAALFTAKGSDNAVNCLAVRLLAKNGVLTDNGMLIDSAASTINGKGNINLGAETINLTLHAKTKLVDIGGLVPAVQIGGTLTDPSYKIDAVGMVKNVIGNLSNGQVDVISSTVPDIQTPPAGQNACVYTLDHPKAASQGILPTDAVGKAGQKINSVLKGLFGQ